MSNNPFKPGGRVRCKISQGGGSLKAGEIYTVGDHRDWSRGNPYYVYVVELPGRGGYIPARFELVTEPEYDWVKVEKTGDLKCGDVVRLNGAEFKVGSVGHTLVDFLFQGGGLAFCTFEEKIPLPGLEVRREKPLPLPLPTEAGIPFWGRTLPSVRGEYQHEGIFSTSVDSFGAVDYRANGYWYRADHLTRLPWPEGELEKFKEKIK